MLGFCIVDWIVVRLSFEVLLSCSIMTLRFKTSYNTACRTSSPLVDLLDYLGSHRIFSKTKQ